MSVPWPTLIMGKEKQMHARKIMALTGIFLVAMVITSAAAAPAKSTKTPVDVWEVSCMQDPGIVWISEDGILHIRGQVTMATFYDSSDFAIVGYDTIVSNANLDPVTSTGTLFGTWSATYLPASETGTFDGSWNARLSGGIAAVGKAVGHGTGDLRGVKMKLNLLVDPADPPPAGLFTSADFPPCDPIFGITHDTGFIHNPRGE
jgi:hypothetical protein